MLPKVKDKVYPQYTNCCTLDAMRYASDILGKPISEAGVLLHFYSINNCFPWEATDEMLNRDAAMNLFNYYLYLSDGYSIMKALELGFPSLGFVNVGPDDGIDYHCVVIVGYNPDNSLIVMDPITGRLTDVEFDSIKEHHTVTDVK